MELFYLASYDLDNFRVFISSPFFHDVYDIEPALLQSLLTDDVALLKFAARYLKQVLFGENTIPEKPARSESAKWREEIMGAAEGRDAPQTARTGYDAPGE